VDSLHPRLMKALVSRVAMLTAAVSLFASPLSADETTGPGQPPQPTLNDILALQTRLEDLKPSDLPDDRKIEEALKLKNAIADTWQQLRDLEALEKDAAPEPDPQDPSELYFRGWLLARDAGKLEEEKKTAEAVGKLDRARRLFDRVARDFPDWKPEMVAGRRAQTAESLARLSKQVLAPERK
jgi:hypothetical protein